MPREICDKIVSLSGPMREYAEMFHHIVSGEPVDDWRSDDVYMADVGFFEDGYEDNQKKVSLKLDVIQVMPKERQILRMVASGTWGYLSKNVSYNALWTLDYCYELAKIFQDLVASFIAYQQQEGEMGSRYRYTPVTLTCPLKKLEDGPTEALMDIGKRSVIKTGLKQKLLAELQKNDLEAIELLYPIFEDHLVSLASGDQSTSTAYGILTCFNSRPEGN